MLALALAALFATAGSTAPRAAVLVYAPGANDAAELERVIATRLANDPDVRLLSVDDIAELLSIDEPLPPAIDAASKAKADALWEQAHKAFVEADYPAALRALDDLSPLVERLSAEERVRAHELSAAVHVKLDDIPTARKEAIATLVVAGELPSDLGYYPPSVRRVFEEAVTGLHKVTLTFNRVTAKAEVTVDDRPVPGASVSLPAGVHRVRVRAKGFRGIERDIALTEDDTMSLALAPALDPATSRILTSVVASGAMLSDDQRRSLDRLAGRLDVDALVLAVRETGAKRAGIWWSTPKDTFNFLGTFGPGADGDGALAERVAGSLAEARRVVTAPTPVPGVTGPARVYEPATHVPHVGLTYSTRSRAVRGADGNGFNLDFTGAGVRVGGAMERFGITGEFELGAQTFGLSSSKVNTPSGGKVALKGGTDLTGRGAIGFLFRGQGAGNQKWRVGPMFEFHVDDWSGGDPTDASGAPLGINPAQLFYTPSIRLEAWVPVTAQAALSGSVNTYPVQGMKYTDGMSEVPAFTTGHLNSNNNNGGNVGAGSSGYRVELGGEWSPRPQWWVGATLGKEAVRTGYVGDSKALFSPAVRDAVETWTLTTFAVTGEYRF
jgi:hypothetical protein